MNFGSKIRGYSSLTNDADTGYFNAYRTIQPIRKPPVICRIKPKVDTDEIRNSLMTDISDRIQLWPVSKGDKTMKINNGTQIINLTSAQNPVPTIVRKLEDVDYRCEDAKCSQEELLPLSRLPRGITSITPNLNIANVFTKPVNSAYDISNEEILSNLKGKLQLKIESNKQININTPTLANQNNLNRKTTEIKKISGEKSANPTIDIYDTNTGSNISKAKILNKLKKDVNVNKIINIEGINRDDNNLQIRNLKKISTGFQTTNMTQTVHIINDIPIHLIKKVTPDKLSAPSNITISTNENKIVQPPKNVISENKVKVDVNPNVEYRLGYLPNKLRSDQDIKLQYKNQLIGKNIDIDRYSAPIPRFDRSLNAGIDSNMNFRYYDMNGVNNIFMPTRSY
jgi:hypothetical protein